MKRIGAILFLVLAVAVSSWAQRSPFKVSEHDTATARVLRNSAPIGLYADSSAFADSSRVAGTTETADFAGESLFYNLRIVSTVERGYVGIINVDTTVFSVDAPLPNNPPREVSVTLRDTVFKGVVFADAHVPVADTCLNCPVGVPDTITGNKVFPDTVTVGVLIEEWPKRYVANLTQTDENPPTAVEFVNTGAFPAWTYVAVGHYRIELPGNPAIDRVWVSPFTTTVTGVAFQAQSIIAELKVIDDGGQRYAQLLVGSVNGETAHDGELLNSPVEIRIYPPLPE